MKTIVFLDFDDVLAISPNHTSSNVLEALNSGRIGEAAELWENIFHERAKENLRLLYDEFALQFVISSSWAKFLTRDQVTEVLNRTGLGFVAEALHEQWRSAMEVGAFRVTEVGAWLQKHAMPASPYLILDDTSSGKTLFGTALESHAVFCEEWIGFVDDHLEDARKILRAQLPK